jgi:hypothetical protein
MQYVKEKLNNISLLGGINKNNGKYVYPKIANKKDKYICCECNKDLILCKGIVRKHHFRHYSDCYALKHINGKYLS